VNRPIKQAQLAHSQRYGVLAFLCLCAAIAYVQRSALSVPAKEIASGLALEDLARQMGWVQSAWYLSYGLMQLPSGWLADRFGSRRTLAILAVCWSLATLLSGFAQDFTSLLALWSLMGAAQAGAFPCAAKAIGQIFPETMRARASGLLASGMTLGGAIAPALTAFALQGLEELSQVTPYERWRLLLFAYSLPGIAWAALFLICVPPRWLPNHRDTDASASPSQSSQSRKPTVDWRIMITSVPLGLLCAQQFLRAAAMVFFVTWFPTFLQETRGVSLHHSGLITTLVGTGGVIGSLTGGIFSDWLLNKTGNSRLARQGIATLGMSCCALLIAGSYFMQSTTTSMALISLGAFCATFGGVSGYTVAIGFGGRYVATVFSTMNMCGNLGAALFPITAGWLVAQTQQWNLVLFLFAGIMAIDAICWALLNPQGTLFNDEVNNEVNAASDH
jgi:MFS family permease